ncbi:MAG TPA: signal peptidase I [Dehalococcoidia bacterium]|nr:signal peptidase I [Dehalococcoidia bacterium]
MTMKSAIRDILWTLLFAIVAFLVLRASVQTVRIDLPSMEPTIKPGWWIMLNKISYHFTDPKRGDIVVFDAPIDPGHDFIKRVIGLPGDTVEVKNNTVVVNGVTLQEPYVAYPPHYTLAPETIPAGQYFVLGDNRDVSIDSHYGWLVPRDKLVGKAWIVIWPPSKWGKAPNYSQLVNRPALDGPQGVAASTTR